MVEDNVTFISCAIGLWVVVSKPLFKLVVIHSDFVPFYTSRLGGEGGNAFSCDVLIFGPPTTHASTTGTSRSTILGCAQSLSAPHCPTTTYTWINPSIWRSCWWIWDPSGSLWYSNCFAYYKYAFESSQLVSTHYTSDCSPANWAGNICSDVVVKPTQPSGCKWQLVVDFPLCGLKKVWVRVVASCCLHVWKVATWNKYIYIYILYTKQIFCISVG